VVDILRRIIVELHPVVTQSNYLCSPIHLYRHLYCASCRRLRLRSISGDFIDAAVAKSAFFSDFPWDALLHMTMEAPFVPAPLPAFHKFTPVFIAEVPQQSVSDITHSYMESTFASRNASVAPNKDMDRAHSVETEEDEVTLERKRQFYLNNKFSGDDRIFAGF
jgi:hypothetical protein